MKAFGINQYGNSRILQEYYLPLPQISNDEVLVKNKFFAINAFDIAVRNGTFRNNSTLLFPFILGSDAIGEIIKIGKNVHNYKIGDYVMAHPGIGTYAEYFKVSSEHIGFLPKINDYFRAAGLPLSGITAYNVLVHIANVQPNQTITILGANGGVGSIIVQMSKALGLKVLGVDMEKNRECVLKFGANEFLSYDTDSAQYDFTRKTDVLIDATNDGVRNSDAIKFLKDEGVYISLTSIPEKYKNFRSIKFAQYKPTPKYLDSDAFFAISLLMRNNQLEVPIDKVTPFSLESLIEGQKLVESNSSNGKVIVKV